ncbi:hypothetical protein EYV94_07155 [Puteibacter caeruleilacunae]|nr:hypothetical protein EYV94_07155 [Puteibacter caeruleilacunae]
MGKIRQGIFGPVEGKVDNLVGASWNGIHYLRSLGHPHIPDSEKQKTSQGKFSAIRKMGHYLKDELLDPIWKTAAQNNQMTSVNLFQRVNHDAFDSEGKISDFSLLKMSPRDLGAKEIPGRPQCLQAFKDPDRENHIIIRWDYDRQLGVVKDNDILHVIVIDEEEIYFAENINAKRVDKAISLNIPNENKLINLYVFFSDNTKTKYSESVYQFVNMDNEPINN